MLAWVFAHDGSAVVQRHVRLGVDVVERIRQSDPGRRRIQSCRQQSALLVTVQSVDDTVSTVYLYETEDSLQRVASEEDVRHDTLSIPYPLRIGKAEVRSELHADAGAGQNERSIVTHQIHSSGRSAQNRTDGDLASISTKYSADEATSLSIRTVSYTHLRAHET